MAEILIRVVDKNQPDQAIAALAAGRGDVISVCPDGWAWSDAELTNPDWRIISVSVLQTTIDAILVIDNDNTGKLRRFRAWSADFSKAPNPALFSGARTQAIITLTRQQALAMISKKA